VAVLLEFTRGDRVLEEVLGGLLRDVGHRGRS
jgi:hypothetical protein